jgi:hypothetical protein
MYCGVGRNVDASDGRPPGLPSVFNIQCVVWALAGTGRAVAVRGGRRAASKYSEQQRRKYTHDHS